MTACQLYSCVEQSNRTIYSLDIDVTRTILTFKIVFHLKIMQGGSMCDVAAQKLGPIRTACIITALTDTDVSTRDVTSILINTGFERK